MFKKLILILLVMSLTGCAKPNGLYQLLDKGLYCSQISTDETSFKALVQNEEASEFYLAKAAISAKEYEKYIAIDFDENYEKNLKAFVNKLSNVEVRDLGDIIPDDDYFLSFIGKTITDIEAAGYSNSGYTLEDTGWAFFYDGSEYSVLVKTAYLAEEINDENWQEVTALEITGIEFIGFSGSFIDNN